MLQACGSAPVVPPPAPKAIAIKVRPVQPVVAVGRRIQLVAEVSADNGQSYDQNEIVTWTVSDATRASVNGLGQVHGVGAGQVEVKALHPDGPEASIMVGVIASDVKRVTLSPNPLHLTLGAHAALTAIAELEGGSSEDVSARATWASNNVGALTVGPSGDVHCVTAGQATIAAIFVGVRGSANAVCE